MVNDGPGSSSDDKEALGGLTEQDLQMGKKATRFIRAVCVVSFVACIAIAMYVFSSVPWETRMPYSGRYGRNGIPMQIAMLPILVPIIGFWRAGSRPKAHHLGKAGRVGVYILLSPMVLACVYGQWAFAKAILVEGGAFPG